MRTSLYTALILMVACPLLQASDASDWKHLEAEGRKAVEKNDFAKAENWFMQAAEKSEKFGLDDERYARSLRWLGLVAIQMEDYPNADFAYTRLIHADGLRLGTNELWVADDLVHLTDVAGYTQQFLRGHESIDVATAIVKEKANKFSPAMGFCYGSRACLELQENHLADAETNFQRALEIFENNKGRFVNFSPTGLQVMQQEHFQVTQTYVAQVLNNFSICQSREKKYAGAEASLLRAIGIIETDYGKNSLQLVNSLCNLGGVYAEEKKFPEADAATRRALTLLRRVDPSHPVVIRTRHLLTKILQAEGKNDEAAKYQPE